MDEAMHFIGGNWARPAEGDTIEVIDPSDGEPFARIARGTERDVDAAAVTSSSVT